jgi:hypothetical protein
MTENESLASLEETIRTRLGTRVRKFRIVMRDGGLALCGQTESYYVKQLALHEVKRASLLPIVANEIEVTIPG